MNDSEIDDHTKEKYKQILKPLLLENVPREYFYLWNLMVDFNAKSKAVNLQMTQLHQQMDALEKKIAVAVKK